MSRCRERLFAACRRGQLDTLCTRPRWQGCFRSVVPRSALRALPAVPRRFAVRSIAGTEEAAVLRLCVPKAVDFTIGQNTVPCLLSTTYKVR